MAIILVGKIERPPAGWDSDEETYRRLLYCGYALFWTGVSVGVSNLACG